MTKDINEWADSVADLVRLIERLPYTLKDLEDPPPGGTPEERLDAVVSLYKRLGVPPTNKTVKPGLDTAERIAFAFSSSHGEVKGSVLRILANGYAAAHEALMAGATHPQVVHSASFGSLAYLGVPSEAGPELPFALGLIDSLPEGHYLRTVLARDDFYLTPYQGPALCLGLCGKGGWPHTSPVPASFYDLPTALVTTRAWRRVQKEAAERARQLEEAKAAERLSLVTNNPANEILKLRQRVKELEQASQAPTPPA